MAVALCHFPSFFTPPHKFNSPHLKWGAHRHPLHKTPTVACSVDDSRKKGKVSKPSKSNEELCNELREFMSAAGLPEDRMPTMKELSDNGRKDLANVVRRRGYKVITELLRHSCKNGSNTDKNSIEDQNFNNACGDTASEDLIESTESSSSPSCSSIMGKHILRKTNDIAASDSSFRPCKSSESSVLTFHSRAADFVQTGKLDKLEEAFDIESEEAVTDSEQKSVNINSSDADAYVDPQVASPLAQQTDRVQVISNQGSEGSNDDENLTSKMAGERINQAEITRLKTMLRQREMDLLELKRQIEKEKQSLCILQDKTHEEIGNAHRMITEKDMELRAVEESLSGLKEVPIEYWGNGETVEVAGSFNGWHNRIKMDLHPSSKSVNSSCSRSLKLWSTILWLYPGIYEIKFIVDGTWRVDPNREISTSCNITNNILRVDT